MSRPKASNDNPYSEAQFKTLKYCPAFPGTFGSLQDARAFCRVFFTYYNHEHRSLGVPVLLHDVAERPLRRASATHLWGVELVVVAALTRVLAVQIGLCNTCCVIMAEFQAL